MRSQRAILIAGPTASGKSALALSIAARVGGVVINADSMQVYRDLAVLTARPTADDGAAAPHALYGYVDGAEAYSVGRWVADAEAAIDAARAAGLVPVVVGGTGLYFKALLDGLSPIPPVPEEIRARWRTKAQKLGASELYRLLAERDPATAAKLTPMDTQRLTRALEVLEATGRPLVAWQAVAGRPVLAADDCVRLVVALDRATLHARAEARLAAMLSGGALEEVRALMARGLSPELPVMRALGVPPLVRMLAGEISSEQAAAETARHTRQYIKRQQTWLNRHMISWKVINLELMERIRGGDFTLMC